MLAPAFDFFDPTKPLRRPIYLALSYAALLAFTALALIPRPPSVDVTHADKAAHFLAFAAASGLAALGAVRPAAARLHATAIFCVGVGIELLQHNLVPERTGSWADAAANTAGLAAGFVVGRILASLAARRAEQSEALGRRA